MTGITSIDEIVTTFVKAEEQNYSLLSYVQGLNTEIDSIEEQNQNIEQEIEKHEKLAEMSASDKEVVRMKLKQEIEERSTQMAEKEN